MPIQCDVYSEKFIKRRNKQNASDSEDNWPPGLSFSFIFLLDHLFLREVKIMWIILLLIRLEKDAKYIQNKIRQ